MGIKLSGGRTLDYRTTSHNIEISEMRAFTKEIMDEYPDVDDAPDLEELQAVVCAAGAALLECHDQTGISLDDWTGPRELVIHALWIIGKGETDFIPNGV